MSIYASRSVKEEAGECGRGVVGSWGRGVAVICRIQPHENTSSSRPPRRFSDVASCFPDSSTCVPHLAASWEVNDLPPAHPPLNETLRDGLGGRGKTQPRLRRGLAPENREVFVSFVWSTPSLLVQHAIINISL